MTRPGSLAAVGAAVRGHAARHPALHDVVLAVVVGAGSVLGDTFDSDGPAGNALFDLALAVPLVARRRWPTGVFLVVSAVAFLQWTGDVQVRGDVAVLIALYTVGAYERRRRLVLLAALIAEIGVVLATVRWAPENHGLGAGLLLTGTVTAAWVFGSYVRTRRAYVSAVVERAATAERERDHQAQIAVAGERSRIARDMHDVVAHSLSVMIALNDGAAATALVSPAETRLAVQQASEVGRQSLAEMRRLLGVLRSGESADLAPQPGHGQLDDLVGKVRSAGLPVALEISGRPADAPPGAQLAVHRIVQESLTNVLKHAPGATRTKVHVHYRPDAVDVEVVNDDPSPQSATGIPGHGLVGMRERAAVYGGHVTAGHEEDGTWRVRTRLLLAERAPV